MQLRRDKARGKNRRMRMMNVRDERHEVLDGKRLILSLKSLHLVIERPPTPFQFPQRRSVGLN